MTSLVVVGGGPAGYEAALVAAELGGEVTLVEQTGAGGACVLTDCVPSKTLIATSEAMTSLAGSPELGVRFRGAGGAAAHWGDDELAPPDVAEVDLRLVNRRVTTLARRQSRDVRARLEREGVRVVAGRGRLRAGVVTDGAPGTDGRFARAVGVRREVEVLDDDGAVVEVVAAEVVLLAVGGRPRELPGAVPDGERVLTWRHLYDLDELPERLVVVGSGVTGAEFANAYLSLGCEVVLVSSRDRVLPTEDADAADLLERVAQRRGMQIVKQARAETVVRDGDGVLVTTTDGREVRGSHALLAVGSVPNTEGLGLDEAGVRVGRGGYVEVDRVSRTSVQGVYAAGDCTGVMLLASVAAMQGRTAVWHAMGQAVEPLRLGVVASNVFTDPEIATVGVTQAAVDEGRVSARSVTLPLGTNPRAKMQGVADGFVKVFCRPGSGTVLGGVVVGPRASELVLGLSVAVQHGLTVDQVAHTFSIYPSLSGSVTEASRQLMEVR